MDARPSRSVCRDGGGSPGEQVGSVEGRSLVVPDAPCVARYPFGGGRCASTGKEGGPVKAGERLEAGEQLKTGEQLNTPRIPQMSRAVHHSILVLMVYWGVAAVSPVAANIPDSTHARRQFLSVMTAPMRRIEEPLREYISQPGGGPDVLIRSYEQRGNRYYVFLHPNGDTFLMDAPGTWVVRRSMETGDIDQVKIFLQHHEESFIRLTPAGVHSRMELSLAGAVLYRGVPVPLSLRRVLEAPFDLVQRATAGVVDWNLLNVDAHHPGYRDVASMVEAIRPVLPEMPDAEDGALDSRGAFVFIETMAAMEGPQGFNCSGFAKWVVDGIYQQGGNGFLEIQELKRRHREYRGTPWSDPLEEQRDPWFGLDWTRNLAVALWAQGTGADPRTVSPVAQDVRQIPFAHYTPNVGYAVRELASILYWLALTEPGNFYLGSVNRSFGSAPVLRQHSHVVVLFPWFDTRGRFHLSVMERNVETGLASLERRYENDFIHLVRLPASRTFQPPGFPVSSR